MNVFELSYLLRYPYVFLIIVFVWVLVSHSIAELRWNIKYRVLPAQGFFLLATDSVSARKGDGLGLPLFHTTVIGRSSSCDIHFKSRLIAKRHAIVYLYNGEWFVRATAAKIPVYVNNVQITNSTSLNNRDVIGIGEASVVFVNEEQSANEAKLDYVPYTEIPYYPKKLSMPKLLKAYLSVNLFTVMSGLLIMTMIPGKQKEAVTMIGSSFLLFFCITNLYYFLLPLFLKNLDRVLMLIIMQLSVIGMLFQARLQLIAEVNTPSTADQQIHFLYSQGLSILIAFLLLPVIAAIVARTHWLERTGTACAVITPVLLIITLIFGKGADAHGAALWISVGGMSIQLTEFAKITYLIVLAGFFKNRASRRSQYIFAGWAAFVFLLIFMLPDLGSAMILLPTTLVVYVVMTSEYLTTLVILLSGTFLGAVSFAFFPHVQRRISGWTTLWYQVNDNNRQIVYGLQAIARGGLFGRGVGNGSPGGIPLASSDMVFSIICEELGLVTGLCIVLIFIIVWLRAAKITVTSHDGYSSSLALGIGTLAFVEAAIVISGVTGLVPLTGATLPLIARGGSSVLTIIILFSILLGLSARREKGEYHL